MLILSAGRGCEGLTSACLQLAQLRHTANIKGSCEVTEPFSRWVRRDQQPLQRAVWESGELRATNCS